MTSSFRLPAEQAIEEHAMDGPWSVQVIDAASTSKEAQEDAARLVAAQTTRPIVALFCASVLASATVPAPEGTDLVTMLATMQSPSRTIMHKICTAVARRIAPDGAARAQSGTPANLDGSTLESIGSHVTSIQGSSETRAVQICLGIAVAFAESAASPDMSLYRMTDTVLLLAQRAMDTDAVPLAIDTLESWTRLVGVPAAKLYESPLVPALGRVLAASVAAGDHGQLEAVSGLLIDLLGQPTLAVPSESVMRALAPLADVEEKRSDWAEDEALAAPMATLLAAVVDNHADLLVAQYPTSPAAAAILRFFLRLAGPPSHVALMTLHAWQPLADAMGCSGQGAVEMGERLLSSLLHMLAADASQVGPAGPPTATVFALLGADMLRLLCSVVDDAQSSSLAAILAVAAAAVPLVLRRIDTDEAARAGLDNVLALARVALSVLETRAADKVVARHAVDVLAELPPLFRQGDGGQQVEQLVVAGLEKAAESGLAGREAHFGVLLAWARGLDGDARLAKVHELARVHSALMAEEKASGDAARGDDRGARLHGLVLLAKGVHDPLDLFALHTAALGSVTSAREMHGELAAMERGAAVLHASQVDALMPSVLGLVVDALQASGGEMDEVYEATARLIALAKRSVVDEKRPWMQSLVERMGELLSRADGPVAGPLQLLAAVADAAGKAAPADSLRFPFPVIAAAATRNAADGEALRAFARLMMLLLRHRPACLVLDAIDSLQPHPCDVLVAILEQGSGSGRHMASSPALLRAALLFATELITRHSWEDAAVRAGLDRWTQRWAEPVIAHVLTLALHGPLQLIEPAAQLLHLVRKERPGEARQLLPNTLFAQGSTPAAMRAAVLALRSSAT